MGFRTRDLQSASLFFLPGLASMQGLLIAGKAASNAILSECSCRNPMKLEGPI